VDRQILETTGKCSECAEYTYPDDERKICVADTCDTTIRQHLDTDGKCHQCPEHSYTNEAGNGCINDECEENQILGSDGKCSFCNEFTYPEPEEGKTCVADTCVEN
jgi:hypothetical protein